MNEKEQQQLATSFDTIAKTENVREALSAMQKIGDLVKANTTILKNVEKNKKINTELLKKDQQQTLRERYDAFLSTYDRVHRILLQLPSNNNLPKPQQEELQKLSQTGKELLEVLSKEEELKATLNKGIAADLNKISPAPDEKITAPDDHSEHIKIFGYESEYAIAKQKNTSLSAASFLETKGIKNDQSAIGLLENKGHYIEPAISKKISIESTKSKQTVEQKIESQLRNLPPDLTDYFNTQNNANKQTAETNLKGFKNLTDFKYFVSYRKEPGFQQYGIITLYKPTSNNVFNAGNTFSLFLDEKGNIKKDNEMRAYGNNLNDIFNIIAPGDTGSATMIDNNGYEIKETTRSNPDSTRKPENSRFRESMTVLKDIFSTIRFIKELLLKKGPADTSLKDLLEKLKQIKEGKGQAELNNLQIRTTDRENGMFRLSFTIGKDKTPFSLAISYLDLLALPLSNEQRFAVVQDGAYYKGDYLHAEEYLGTLGLKLERGVGMPFPIFYGFDTGIADKFVRRIIFQLDPANGNVDDVRRTFEEKMRDPAEKEKFKRSLPASLRPLSDRMDILAYADRSNGKTVYRLEIRMFDTINKEELTVPLGQTQSLLKNEGFDSAISASAGGIFTNFGKYDAISMRKQDYYQKDGKLMDSETLTKDTKAESMKKILDSKEKSSQKNIPVSETHLDTLLTESKKWNFKTIDFAKIAEPLETIFVSMELLTKQNKSPYTKLSERLKAIENLHKNIETTPNKERAYFLKESIFYKDKILQNLSEHFAKQKDDTPEARADKWNLGLILISRQKPGSEVQIYVIKKLLSLLKKHPSDIPDAPKDAKTYFLSITENNDRIKTIFDEIQQENTNPLSEKFPRSSLSHIELQLQKNEKSDKKIIEKIEFKDTSDLISTAEQLFKTSDLLLSDYTTATGESVKDMVLANLLLQLNKNGNFDYKAAYNKRISSPDIRQEILITQQVGAYLGLAMALTKNITPPPTKDNYAALIDAIKFSKEMFTIDISQRIHLTPEQKSKKIFSTKNLIPHDSLGATRLIGFDINDAGNIVLPSQIEVASVFTLLAKSGLHPRLRQMLMAKATALREDDKKVNDSEKLLPKTQAVLKSADEDKYQGYLFLKDFMATKGENPSKIDSKSAIAGSKIVAVQENIQKITTGHTKN